MGVSVFQGWFSFAGRRNRKSYFLFNLLLLVVFAALVGLVFASAPTLEEFDVAVVVDEDRVTVEGEVAQEGGEMQGGYAVIVPRIHICPSSEAIPHLSQRCRFEEAPRVPPLTV